jgi:hypothetical protein
MSTSARLVGVACALFYMNFSTLGDVRPGVPRLVELTGLSASTVQRALDEMVKAHYLRKVKRGHRRSASLYVGMFPNRHEAEPAPEADTWRCPSCGFTGREKAPGRRICIECVAA